MNIKILIFIYFFTTAFTLNAQNYETLSSLDSIYHLSMKTKGYDKYKQLDNFIPVLSNFTLPSNYKYIFVINAVFNTDEIQFRIGNNREDIKTAPLNSIRSKKRWSNIGKIRTNGNHTYISEEFIYDKENMKNQYICFYRKNEEGNRQVMFEVGGAYHAFIYFKPNK